MLLRHSAALSRPRAALAARVPPPLGHLRHARAILVRATQAGDESEEDLAERLASAEALFEAQQLYVEAQEMSHTQVLQELMQMRVSDMAFYDDGPPAVPITTSCSSSPSTNSASGGAAKHPGSVRRVHVPVSASALRPLQSFWVEQGLQAHAAHSIAQDMVASGSPCAADLTLLATQVQRLGRVIPGGRVQDMVARDWRILDASVTSVAEHLVQLVRLFPNNLDVLELACKKPALLYCDDLVGLFEAVVTKLSQLHPSHSREVARSLLVEYPDLMFRMGWYMHVRTLDELPVELQSWMIFTGQGLHQLHQHYSTSPSPRFL